jgi:hypothetical protein
MRRYFVWGDKYPETKKGNKLKTDVEILRKALEDSIASFVDLHDKERLQCVERMKEYSGKDQTEFAIAMSMRSYHEGALNGYGSVLRMLENQANIPQDKIEAAKPI